jgi:hypothetical protein
MTTALIGAASAQAPTPDDPHHPPQGVGPASTQPTPPTAGSGGLQGAQPGMMGAMPMMNMMSSMPNMMEMMRAMGAGMGGMPMIDRIEGRVAFLRAELKITDAQASAWNVFADALRTNAQKLGAVRASMMPGPGMQPQPLTERLDRQEQWLAARLEGTRTIKSAFTNLYGTLSDDQKKTADELLAPHMGLEMIGMSAQMGLGQMGPGRMGPGQMQPGQMQRPPANR